MEVSRSPSREKPQKEGDADWSYNTCRYPTKTSDCFDEHFMASRHEKRRKEVIDIVYILLYLGFCRKLSNDDVGVARVAVFQGTAEGDGFETDDPVKYMFGGRSYSRTTQHLCSSVCSYFNANRLNVFLFLFAIGTRSCLGFSGGHTQYFIGCGICHILENAKQSHFVGDKIRYLFNWGALQSKSCGPPPS